MNKLMPEFSREGIETVFKDFMGIGRNTSSIGNCNCYTGI